MPIFEFRCLECNNIFEKLVIRSDERVEMACPDCNSQDFERIISRSSYAMAAGPGGNKPNVTTKSCGPSNKCMTLDIPGPRK